MGRLTTHVLDTASGKPAAGLAVALFCLAGGNRTTILNTITNNDGRVEDPLLAENTFKAGIYELEFKAGDYFRSQGVELSDPAFLDEIVLRFGLAEDNHYHVPLLVSPYSYSTYRGS